MKTQLTVIIVFSIAALVTMGMHGCSQEAQTEREAIKAGLVQKERVGSPGVVWSKP